MKTFIGALALAACLAMSSQAAVIYNSFGPADGFSNSGWLIGESDNGLVNQLVGAPFTPAATATLGSLELALGRDPIGYEISIWDDNGLGRPGVKLESWNTGSILTGILLFDSIIKPSLAGGSQYWIFATPLAGTSGSWKWTNPRVDGPLLYDEGNGLLEFNDRLTAFRVNADEVPEPGTFVAGFVLMAMGVVIRRRAA
jgi:hypothetical protein